MKLLRILLIGLVVVVVVLGAAAAFLLQDPNRFKPRLEALIAEQTGVPVTIGGDLGWRLWPPVSLSAADVRAEPEGQRWQLGRLTLRLDAIAALRDPEQWRVESLTVRDAVLEQEGSVLTVSEARLSELTPNRPAPLAAELSYAAEGGEPVPVSVRGAVTLNPDTLGVTLADAHVITPAAEGVCDVEALPVADPVPGPEPREDDLIPVALFRAWSWSGECLLDRVQVDDRRFANVHVELDNAAGESKVLVRAPEFFGGEAVADIAVDAASTPVRWTVTPTLTEVDSQALMAWLDQRLDWVASLAYGGTLRFEGNTTEALVASMSGATAFDGGQGRIDISTIRNQALALATMLNEGERVQRWPEMWDYQRLVGEWRIDGRRHELEAALDNLGLSAEGVYDPLSDELDMLLTLVFTDDPALPVFELNPLLYDLPIPVRCRGTLAEPSCRVDQQVAQRIVAEALSGENSALRGTLERKIEEDVPEEYRDAARSLLDVLSGSRRNRTGDQ